MRSVRKLSVLVVFLVFAVSLVSGAGDCSVGIDVSKEGLTENSVGFSISPRSGYYYPEGGEWTLGIPIQAEEVVVRDGDGDSLDMSVSSSTDLFKAVSFENDERVSGGETYRFEISYEMPRGVILYGGSAYMEQYLPVSFCNGERSVNVDYPRAWDVRNSSLEDGVKGPGSISYQNTYQDTLRLTFDGKYDYAPVKNYSQGIFNVSVPSRYSSYVLSKIEELDSFNKDIEQLTGVETPGGFHVAYLSFDSARISDEASGQYYGGRIEIKSTQLSESDLQHMETLTHELVHGYNDRLSSSSPDWWWEEGTAEYISKKVLKQNGYNVSGLRPSRERVEYSFENCSFQRSFISAWSPVDETGVEQFTLFPCSDGVPEVTVAGSSEDQEGENSPEIDPITDKDLLGYKYSELIVAEMFEGSSKNVSDVYELMLERNVTFSSSRGLMNNQINYFASKALDRDMTEFLREKGVSTASWGYEEEQLTEAEDTITDLNSSYPHFQVFSTYFRELDSIRKAFYAGRFEEVEKVSEVVENAEKRNRTLHQTLKQVESTRSSIRGLEERTGPEFFSAGLREVNQTVELVGQAKFERAQDRLEELETRSREKMAAIDKAGNRTEELRRKVEQTNLLVRPFLMGAGESLEEAEASLQEGSLERAERKLSAAEEKVENSETLASVFYLLLVAGSIYISRNFL